MTMIEEQEDNLTNINARCFNPEPITISFKDITYKVSYKKNKEEKVILNNVSGVFHPKKLTAILGPSGAGKTSLMNILAKNKKIGVTGNIMVNGLDRDFDEFQWKSSYISQESSLFLPLTIKETMMIAAEMKLSQKTDKDKKEKIIYDIATLLGLQKSMNTRVGSLSGGEIKRLSIGIELITNPPIMFFDEPTSGLDSVSSLQIISYLRRLAVKGHTIICVIHQPSSKLFNMFDDLLVMSNGRNIYNGAVDNMLDEFASAGFEYPDFYNRADFALEIASGDINGDLEMLITKASSDMFQSSKCIRNKYNDAGGKSSENRSYQVAPLDDNNDINSYTSYRMKKNTYATSSWHQFKYLIKRSTICTLRDPQLAKVRLIGNLILGLLIAVPYYGIGNDAAKVQSNAALLFFLMLLIFYSNALLGVITIPAEAAVIQREQQSNWYSITAYFFSKLLVDIVLVISGPTISFSLIYFITYQPFEVSRFFMTWLIIILLAFLSQILGLLIGVLVAPDVGMFLLSIISQPLIAFSGFFLRFSEIPVYYRFLTFLSNFGYTFEGLLLGLYDYDRPNLDCSEDFCYLRNPKKFLKQMDVIPGNYYYDVLCLTIYVITLVILLYISMHYKIWKSRRI